MLSALSFNSCHCQEFFSVSLKISKCKNRIFAQEKNKRSFLTFVAIDNVAFEEKHSQLHPFTTETIPSTLFHTNASRVRRCCYYRYYLLHFFAQMEAETISLRGRRDKMRRKIEKGNEKNFPSPPLDKLCDCKR
jgi:hypothetical protein